MTTTLATATIPNFDDEGATTRKLCIICSKGSLDMSMMDAREMRGCVPTRYTPPFSGGPFGGWIPGVAPGDSRLAHPPHLPGLTFLNPKLQPWAEPASADPPIRAIA